MTSFNFETTGEEVASICSESIRGKTMLVTGPSPNSLAAEFVKTIAVHAPAMIILASRDTTKLESVAASIKDVAPEVITRLLKLDLASQEQIRVAAQEVLDYDDVPHIDVLVNSAGLMAVPFGKTADGIELTFGTNHVGHFLFTNLIIQKLVSEDGSRVSRIVNISSNGHAICGVRFGDWNFEDGEVYNRWLAYGQSKTANMLFTMSLATRLGEKGVISVSLHPGAIPSGLSTHLSEEDWLKFGDMVREMGLAEFSQGFHMKTQQQGVATYVFAAFHESITAETNGRYYRDSQIMDYQDYACWARDSVDAEKLWKLSEKLVGQEFVY